MLLLLLPRISRYRDFLTNLRLLSGRQRPKRCRQRYIVRTTLVVVRAQLRDGGLGKNGDSGILAAVRLLRRRFHGILEVGAGERDCASGWLARGRIRPSEPNSDGSQQDRFPAKSAQPNCPKIADMIWCAPVLALPWP